MRVLKFHSNKLLSFEDREIFIFLRLGWDYLTTPLLKGFLYKTAVNMLVNGVITYQKQQISERWYCSAVHWHL